jgi:hypothetical protein
MEWFHTRLALAGTSRVKTPLPADLVSMHNESQFINPVSNYEATFLRLHTDLHSFKLTVHSDGNGLLTAPLETEWLSIENKYDGWEYKVVRDLEMSSKWRLSDHDKWPLINTAAPLRFAGSTAEQCITVSDGDAAVYIPKKENFLPSSILGETNQGPKMYKQVKDRIALTSKVGVGIAACGLRVIHVDKDTGRVLGNGNSAADDAGTTYILENESRVKNVAARKFPYKNDDDKSLGLDMNKPFQIVTFKSDKFNGESGDARNALACTLPGSERVVVRPPDFVRDMAEEGVMHTAETNGYTIHVGDLVWISAHQVRPDQAIVFVSYYLVSDPIQLIEHAMMRIDHAPWCRWTWNTPT